MQQFELKDTVDSKTKKERRRDGRRKDKFVDTSDFEEEIAYLKNIRNIHRNLSTDEQTFDEPLIFPKRNKH